MFTEGIPEACLGKHRVTDKRGILKSPLRFADDIFLLSEPPELPKKMLEELQSESLAIG